MHLNLNNTVYENFYAPLFQALDSNRSIRNCPEYSDRSHVFSSVSRVIENVESGREWIQQSEAQLERKGRVGEFFDALRSTRRTAMVASIAEEVAAHTKASTLSMHDPLSTYEELNGFEVFASDGHTLAPSAHEDMIEGKVRSHTHIFSLSLRGHYLTHLELCTPEIGKKKEREIKTLQRIKGRALRMGAAKGMKVIHCYDPAVVGYQHWKNWKQGNGVYIITVEKSNSALKLVKELTFEASDPRNNGVVCDESVISSEGIALRRVTSVDPVTNKRYRFLTNEMTLPPGIIAFLYKLCWDIEKSFDQSKNKFHEQKGWAKSNNSKKQQACLITIVHNLCILLERKLQAEEDIVDQKSRQKRQKLRNKEKTQAKENGNPFNAMVGACNRITQRSLQFIRWLRGSLRIKTPWTAAIEVLRPLMLEYLS